MCLFFVFSFFSLKDVRTITFVGWLPKPTMCLELSDVFGIYFSGAGHRTLLEGGCHLRNSRSCEMRCL